MRLRSYRIGLGSAIVGFALAFSSSPAVVSAGDESKKSSDSAKSCYLFSYFVDNGQDGLHLAWSEDGYKWSALNNGKSFLTPKVGESKLMRDPSLLRGPDGAFHLVWTTSWKGKTIGYGSSKDLIHWSQQRAIPVMAYEPGCQTCWAPELFYEASQKRFLIVWSSSIRGKFNGEKRVYAVTTADFDDFTSPNLFFDPGYNVIDETIVPFEGKYRLIFKDERDIETGKTLKIAVGDTMEGPWGPDSKPFARRMVEGPTWLKIGMKFIVYFDCFRDGHFGAMTTTDFKQWDDVTDRLVMPQAIRHGTALEVPSRVIMQLQKPEINRNR